MSKSKVQMNAKFQNTKKQKLSRKGERGKTRNERFCEYLPLITDTFSLFTSHACHPLRYALCALRSHCSPFSASPLPRFSPSPSLPFGKLLLAPCALRLAPLDALRASSSPHPKLCMNPAGLFQKLPNPFGLFA